MTQFDIKSLVSMADPDRKRPERSFRFSNGRTFIAPRNPYANYQVGVGAWAIGKDFVVRPDDVTTDAEIEDWLTNTWPLYTKSGDDV